MLLAIGAMLCPARPALAEPRALPAEVEDNWDEILRALPGGAKDDASATAEPPKAAEPGEGPSEANERAIQKEWEALEPGDAQEQPSKRSRRSKKEGSTKKRARDERTKPIKRGVSASYQGLIAQWHAPAPRDQSYLSETTPALVFQVVGEATPFVILVPDANGGPFEPDQLEVARTAFRGGPGSSVNERLLGLIHLATRHFDAPYVHLVSGIRRDRGASRHTHGLAADIVLPGVEDEDLADFFRQQGFIGVGVYTRAGFVHVDVRDRSFFWVDPSAPGKSMKIRPVRAEEAKAADEAAIARGEEPFVNPPKLSRALAKRASKKRAKRAETTKKAAKPQT